MKLVNVQLNLFFDTQARVRLTALYLEIEGVEEQAVQIECSGL